MQARDRVSNAWYEANPGYSTEQDDVLNDPDYASYAWPDAQGLANTINNDLAGFHTKQAAVAAAHGKIPTGFIQSAAVALGPAAVAIIGDFLNGRRNSLNDVIASTPVGRKGAPIRVNPGTNASASIGGRDYSGHALDRMQERGIPPSAVENTIQNGQRMSGNTPRETLHYDPVNNISVVTNTQTGSVVTVRYGPP